MGECFFLVLAHPDCPGQNLESHRTVVVVVVLNSCIQFTSDTLRCCCLIILCWLTLLNTSILVQVLRQLISTTLTQASADGLTSVAFPALGTGYLQFPSGLVARALFEEIKSFSGSSPQTSVSRVLLVVHDSDTETLNVSHVIIVLEV